jgi:catecholate siderophore receptor
MENTEIGFKYDLDAGASLAVSYFTMDQTQAKSYDNGTGEVTEEAGMEIDGFEITLNGQVNDQNLIKFGLTSVDSTSPDRGAPNVTQEVPELTYSLWWNNQVNDIFDISLGLTYQDQSLINEKDQTGPSLPDYTRFDMAMTIKPSDNDIVRINIENLTDEVYYPHSHSNHQVSVGESANVRVSYNKRF